MTFIVRTMTAPCEDKELISSIITHLANNGYDPLIVLAKQQFLGVFGKNVTREAILQDLQPGSPVPTFDSDHVLRLSSVIYNADQGLLSGDLFCSPYGNGFLYVRLARSQHFSITITLDGKPVPPPLQLEIGYLGDKVEVECLSNFAELVAETLTNQGKNVQWSLVRPSNSLFNDLLHSDEAQFVTADTISKEDAELAGKLEDQVTREVAIAVKRAGGMLVEDVGKKVAKQEDADKAIEELVQANLITREFVIICRQTSKQINRITSRDAIVKMTEAGILCACGSPIEDERVEELFLPTLVLEKLLKQSYWNTARLVYILRQLGVEDNCILLNLHEGPEEVDAFVDMDGAFLMFELKDDEFSMGHAYRFGSRIGLYQPDYAIIVSTKGVAPEVKIHFAKIKPQSILVYIDKMSQLTSSLENILKDVYSKRAVQVLADLDSVTIPLLPVLASKIGFRLTNRQEIIV